MIMASNMIMPVADLLQYNLQVVACGCKRNSKSLKVVKLLTDRLSLSFFVHLKPLKPIKHACLHYIYSVLSNSLLCIDDAKF